MKYNYKNLVRRIGGFLLAALMLTGVGMMSATSAEAQWRRGRVVIVRPYRPWGYGYRYGYRPYYNPYSQYVFSNPETAESSGYRNGLKVGEEDGRKHKSYSPERSHYFQEAGFGNFAEAFREGFARGYREGYGPA
jgi:hypothetical protein